jgi:hypothetical protein
VISSSFSFFKTKNIFLGSLFPAVVFYPAGIPKRISLLLFYFMAY